MKFVWKILFNFCVLILFLIYITRQTNSAWLEVFKYRLCYCEIYPNTLVPHFVLFDVLSDLTLSKHRLNCFFTQRRLCRAGPLVHDASSSMQIVRKYARVCRPGRHCRLGMSCVGLRPEIVTRSERSFAERNVFLHNSLFLHIRSLYVEEGTRILMRRFTVKLDFIHHWISI